jgi:putative ABC transport system permease protein
VPATQVPFPSGRLLVRSQGTSAPMEAAIRTAVHGADAQLPVEEVRTLDQLRSERLTSPGVTTALLAIFAAVALAITLAGLAGLVSTSVSQRTREFGLRIALGASRGEVLRMVLSQGTWLVLAGIGFGAAGAYWFAKLISPYLFATPPTDPVAYALVALVLVGAALVASFGPRVRATAVDPLVALRDA